MNVTISKLAATETTQIRRTIFACRNKTRNWSEMSEIVDTSQSIMKETIPLSLGWFGRITF